MCGLSVLDRLGRKVLSINTQKPFHVGPFQLQAAGSMIFRDFFTRVFPDSAEYPQEHIKKMDPNVGGNSPGLGFFAFPTVVIPLSPGSYIPQIDIIHHAGRTALDFLLQILDYRMQPQLKDSMNFSARFFFNFCQGIHIPGIQNERFFTNGIGLLTQGKTDVRIVKVVWGTNANIIDLGTIPSEFVDMPVKSFKLRKKVGLWKMGINDPHTVKFVECRYQGVARVLDRLHVTRSNVSCRSDKSKVFHLP